MTLLNCIGGAVLQGVEGMLHVRLATHEASVVIPIAKIEGIADLIPFKPGHSWLFNNHIDVETWNMLYD